MRERVLETVECRVHADCLIYKYDFHAISRRPVERMGFQLPRAYDHLGSVRVHVRELHRYGWPTEWGQQDIARAGLEAISC